MWSSSDIFHDFCCNSKYRTLLLDVKNNGEYFAYDRVSRLTIKVRRVDGS